MYLNHELNMPLHYIIVLILSVEITSAAVTKLFTYEKSAVIILSKILNASVKSVITKLQYRIVKDDLQILP